MEINDFDDVIVFQNATGFEAYVQKKSGFGLGERAFGSTEEEALDNLQHTLDARKND